MTQTVLSVGVFDILSPAHLRHFREARALGDSLFVSVTSDEFTAKGPGRPVFPERVRVEMVGALRCVDYAQVRQEPTAVQTILSLRPAVYCKGTDYLGQMTPALVEEKQAVESYGGRLAFTGGDECHSTQLVPLLNTLLYLRGSPGTGKSTVARILEQRLGWRLFWLHELDNLCKMVGVGRGGENARFFDDVTRPVLHHLFARGGNVIYVRPSRDAETVARVRDLAATAGYRTVVVRLTADYETLCRRVTARSGADYRVSTVTALDEYLAGRPEAAVHGEILIPTDGRPPEAVAEEIERVVCP